MAVDSQNKRMSAVGVGLPFRGYLPIPDGIVGSGDRKQILTLYRGDQIEVTGPVFWVKGEAYLPGFQEGQAT